MILLAAFAGCVTTGNTAVAVVNTTIEVDAAKTVNTFKPYNIFGNNVNGWSNPEKAKDKIQGAGNYLLRYPGGSWGDGFFWNTTGAYDANGNWVPSISDYTNSTTGDLVHGQENMVDEDNLTAWRTNTDTDFPDKQWVYLDFKSQKNPDSVLITWGDAGNKAWPYPKKFTVQYWDTKEGRQWMPYGADRDAWLATSAKGVAGTGGKQEVKFTPVKTQYIRILMSESSAGKNGAYSISEIKAFEKGEDITIRDKNNIVVSSCNTAAKLGSGASWIWGFEQFMDFMNTFGPIKASPLIIVNVGSGTPQMAAAWVKYANKVKNYGIKYWEIGNENGGQWEVGGPMNVYDYARRYIKFYEAMKAADPSITIIGQAQSDGNSQAYDGVSHIEAFLGRLAKENKVHYAEGLVSHHYPTWDMHISDLLASPAKQMQDMAAQLGKALAKYPKLKNVSVWVTEFNTSDHVKPHDMSVRLDNALWLAQYMPEFIRPFGTRGYMNLWDVMNGGSAITNETGGDHGYLQAEDGAYKFQERADYWAIKMMTNYWATPGDDREHTMVDAASGNTLLAVYGNLKPDGALALLVVNKSRENAYRTAISIKGYTPAQDAKTWRFDKDNYQWNTDSTPYHAEPSEPPTEAGINNAAGEFSYEFRPFSINVILLKKK